MRAALSESPTPISPSTSTFAHPLLTSLQPYITPLDPTSCFTDLVEIAEGESGSVFAARVSPSSTDPLPIPAGTSHLAIKRIPLPPPLSASSLAEDSPLSSKLSSLLHELALLKDLNHEHLLLLDAVYVGPSTDDDDGAECASALDTSLWIRMELMERSLADVIGLVGDGLALQERMVARFANDVLHGLEYLQKQYIAHRDVRSDNLLLNASGVVKLADFSNAVRVTRNTPTATGAVGVIYWQAPEMRAGPYNALKVDLWSLGATVWELAETVPPFSMPASPSTQTTFSIQSARQVGPQWPPLSHPEHYSRGFHEFLRLCGREAAGRPGPGELLNTPFIRNACGRAVILQLLSQCRSIEEVMVAREAAGDGLS
ncbi:kinase-like protein [Paxillus ammoniavirescens]|nr:kinase-like protein [Paxillus ammoniavirescens]